jgi:hypothetical protein
MNYLAAVHLFHRLLVCVYQIDDGGGFTGSWGTIEQNIGEVFVFQHIQEDFLVIWVEHNIVKLGGAILFAPRLGFFVGSIHWANNVVNFIWFGWNR